VECCYGLVHDYAINLALLVQLIHRGRHSAVVVADDVIAQFRQQA